MTDSPHDILEKIEHSVEKSKQELYARINDIKWFIGSLTITIGLFSAGLSIIVGVNLNSEKTSLVEFKKELKNSVDKRLGSIDRAPKIEMLNLNGGKLDGSTVDAIIYIKNNKYYITRQS